MALIDGVALVLYICILPCSFQIVSSYLEFKRTTILTKLVFGVCGAFFSTLSIMILLIFIGMSPYNPQRPVIYQVCVTFAVIGSLFLIIDQIAWAYSRIKIDSSGRHD